MVEHAASKLFFSIYNRVHYQEILKEEHLKRRTKKTEMCFLSKMTFVYTASSLTEINHYLEGCNCPCEHSITSHSDIKALQGKKKKVLERTKKAVRGKSGHKMSD